MRRGLLWVGLTFLFGGMALVIAQEDCPSIVDDAIARIHASCENTGRNQACYGNVSIDATLRDSTAVFATSGDIVELNDIAALSLAPMDDAANIWGMTLMRLQANLSETSPGQNVTVLAFG